MERRKEYPKGEEGFFEIVKPGDGTKYLGFGILKLKKEQSWELDSGGREYVFLILKGYSKVGNLEIGPRKDVFSSKASAVYVPKWESVRIEAIYDSEIAIVSAPAREKYEMKLVKPEEVRVRVVGQGNWRRHVHDVVYENVDANMLLVGETFNPPGNWSSYPPHRHDVDDIPYESDMEEVYHYRIKPKHGFGVQLIYTDDKSVDELIKIENGLTVIIDRGYHPVVAAPGYTIYYLWALAGEKRILIPRDDPKHAWIKDVEAILRDW